MLGFARYELHALEVGPAKAGDGCTFLGFWTSSRLQGLLQLLVWALGFVPV